ncbi:uncharacterized protein LOC118426661 [Branchiostoma floridae]|uniref:Uncharacterized protein LOC118426661 n=1 Tax=Branchiostoma floridae TaxID=7739 RepID=A0A9J7M0F4_BRAFL|nr:uncharacterized protein LOC118426661 [Branchiostoma floridae]
MHNLCANLYQDLLDHLVETKQLQAWHLEHVAHESLKTLRLKSCSKVLDVDSVKLISMRCPNLEEVSLFKCKKLPVQSIQLMVGNLAHLRVLNINCTTADDTTMKTLARGCPELEELGIMNTNVTDVGLFELCGLGESGEGCKKLAVLQMYDLAKVTLFGVSYVIRALKELRKVTTEHNIGLAVYGIYQECLLHNLPLLPLKLDLVSFSSSTAEQSSGVKTFTPAPASYIKGLILCPNLKVLVLNAEMLADMDEEILLGLSKLTRLAVADSYPELDDGTFHRDVLPFLSKVGAKLTLDWATLVGFSDLDMLAVSAHCPKVQNLVFQSVQGIARMPDWQVEDSAFQNINSFYLDILVDDVPQESLRYQLERVLKNAPKLKHLHLEYVHCFTDDFMSDVMKCNKLEFLENLELIECHGVTRKTIEALLSTAHNLGVVAVHNCDQLKQADLDYLTELAAMQNIDLCVVDKFDKEYEANNNNREEQLEEELEVSVD